MGNTSGFDYLVQPLKELLGRAGITEPTAPQLEASPRIARGESVLIVAPTGSGKTEAAFLPLLSRLVKEGHGQGISLLYITPLRALNRDMLRRLEYWCSSVGLRIDIRHGDTPVAQRKRQSMEPPDVLVTTPETLQAILPGARMRTHLKALKAVVVDELHNLAESKRGVQLCVGLERLRKVAGEFQLVALSATVGSPERAAEFIFGDRNHAVIRTPTPKEFRYSVEYPAPELDDAPISKATFSSIDLAARLSTINKLLDSHNSALIFVNSRTLAEMLGEKLSRLRNDVGVHHGSLPREERERVELAFKAGQLKVIVCTSTLELGIDVGSVDLVIQYMSPRQVTSLIQRVGRSGHSVGRRSEGAIIAVSAEDVLESSAAILEAQEGRLERTEPYSTSLDVLAHQVAGYLMDFESVEADPLLRDLQKLSPYSNLSEDSFWRVVRYLDELRKLRVEGRVLKRTRGTREYYFENLSTIPDETRYLVIDVANNQGVGILGEEFVLLRAKVGLHFILKGRIWQIEKVADDRKIYVTSVEDPLAAIPGWDGEMQPVPFGLAQRTGRLRGRISELLDSNSMDDAIQTLRKELPADEESVGRVVEEIAEHKRTNAPVPTDKFVLVEGFQKYLIVHSCLGEKVNRVLGYVAEEILSRRGLIRLWWMDGYRILFELTEETEDLDLSAISKQTFAISPEELERTYAVALQRNFPFPNRVKTIAERFGAIKRGKYISHPNLCSLPTRFESTPVYEEALQETGRDLIDMRTAKNMVLELGKGTIGLEVFQSGERPTPIAYHILYRYMDVPELVAPDSLAKTTIQRMKVSIYGTAVELICMKCGESLGQSSIGELEEEPRCAKCGSGLLTPNFWTSNDKTQLIGRRLGRETLNADENKELSKLRRAADLVLSYGRRAVIAQAVYGIGPQTASRILAEMKEDEDEFYKSLLEAKLKFISTRPFW